MLPITSLFAGLVTLLFLALSVRVILQRQSKRVSMGDGGDRDLMRRTRAQANCAEYAPLAVLLLALAELQGAPDLVLVPLGLALLAGRTAHAIGFSRVPQIMALRVSGMMLTLIPMALIALGLIGHALL